MSVDRIAVPAAPTAIKGFIEATRERYLNDLSKIRSMVDVMVATRRELRCIYKIYSRGSLQNGDELKSSRKIRLKFDEFNLELGVGEASVFDVPDIVGLTIVVSYPSDISTVSERFDALVEAGELIVPFPVGRTANVGKIVTRHGRAIESGGYYACHYNVRLPAITSGPICEVQIKTLLHDAWGAKTHDLTYKPAGKIGAELLDSFELLGTNLANLDLQSDVLRTSIMRTASVRESKRRKLQVAILRENAAGRIDRLAASDTKDKLTLLHVRIGTMSSDTPVADGEAVLRDLLAVFKLDEQATMRVLCYLAAVTQEKRFFEQGQDAIRFIEDHGADEVARIRSRTMAALAAFSVGEVGEAIDIAEQAKVQVNALSLTGLTADKREALDDMSIALCSSLAYYHADIVGSHDGNKRQSAAKAAEYLRESVALYGVAGLPAAGLFAEDHEIINAIKSTKDGLRAFYALDNEAFVMIQTATTETEIRRASERMHMIHSNRPAQIAGLSDLVRDYHDFCARMRLAELEVPAS